MRRPPLVIGAPVHRRHWCLDEWFDSLEAQDPPDGTQLIFLLSEPGDPSERVILRRWPSAELLYAEGLPSFGEDEKDDPRRYAVLALLRNRLLRAVAAMAPGRYLSWDSDIVLEPGALRALWEPSIGAPASGVVVGALVDMGGGVAPGCWSWMHLVHREAFRPPGWSPAFAPAVPFEAGVVMGVKLMTPYAYRTARYTDHVEGEDVGFALSCEALRIPRLVAPEARGRHLYRLA